MKFLILGLGNIGREYSNTRHNIGFKVADAFVESAGAAFSSARYGDRAEVKFKGRTFVVIKPSTYMNRSGDAARYWLTREKLEPESMLVVLDDLALPMGSVRLRAKGNDGGHNGLKSIDSTLGTNGYPRLRCGIGNEYPLGFQVDYVLGEWGEEDKKVLEGEISTAVEIIKSFGTQGLERTMNLYNKKGVGAKSDD